MALDNQLAIVPNDITKARAALTASGAHVAHIIWLP